MKFWWWSIMLVMAQVAGPQSCGAATLRYTDGLRMIETPGQTQQLVTWTPDAVEDWQQVEAEGVARLVTQLGSQSLSVTAACTGFFSRSLAVWQMRFQVTEAVPYLLSAGLALVGEGGFACASLVDLAHQEEPLALLQLPGIPFDGTPGNFTFQGTLAPGRYELEAIIYTGDVAAVAQSSLQLSFTIPEPTSLTSLLAVSAWPLRRRRHRPEPWKSPRRVSRFP